MGAQVCRAAHRIDPFAEQKPGLQPLPLTGPEEDRHIHLARPRQDRLIGCQHPQINVRLQGTKAFQPGHQPEPREGDRGADCYLRRLGAGAKRRKAGADVVQPARHRVKKPLPFRRHFDGAVQPGKQAQGQRIFKRLDLPTDRTLGQA